MPDYGLTDQGFIIQTRAEIREELEEEFRSEFGRSLPLGNKSALGFLIGLVSDRLGALWEIQEANYNQMDPDAAVKAALRSLCLLTGTFKLEATASVAMETLCGDDASVIPVGTIFSAESTGKRFETTEPATLVLLDSWAPTFPYIVGDRVTNADLCFECVVAGTSDGSGGPDTDAEAIVDGTVTWRCIGEGTSAADTPITCLEAGEIFAAALDINVIETPVGGLTSARNLEDTTVGREEDTDEQLRLRREGDLASPGTGPVDAIRSALLELTDVQAVTVFFNNTDEEDGDGLPPHSVEALVRGGDDQDIWDCLWANVAAGIRTHGDEEGTVVDSQGRDQTLKFTRPTEVPIHVIVTLVKDPRTYPADGDAQVREAIATWGAEQLTGRDVDSSALSARVFQVTGVLKVSSLLIGTVDPPTTDTTITINLRQLASYDTANIDVVTSDRVP